MPTVPCAPWLLIGAVALVLVRGPGPSPVAAQARARVSLAEAIELALRSNSTLAAKQAELRSVRSNEITAGLRPNPTASYAAEQLGSPGTEPQHTVIVALPIET